MSAADDRAAMYAATYGYYGLAAYWGGSNTAVLVIKEEPDVSIDIGRTFVKVPQVLLKVRSIEVTAPAAGDLVVMGTQTYKIDAEPMVDRYGEIFTCEAVRQ